MKPHLFSAEGEAALAAIVQRRVLLGFDFDGTLAPIVPRPDDARVSAAVAHTLQRLSALRPVAIVTGRRVADVAPRLGFEPQYIVGNHGAEDPHGAPMPALDAVLQPLRERLAERAGELRTMGVQVEDKGHSLAFHYRLARDRDAASAFIDRLLDPVEPGLDVFGGKCVVNVVVQGAPDKADAVHALMRRAGAECAFFIGDDLNDEAVFERAPPDWLTVRIGREGPSSARYFLDATAEVAAMLRKMLARLEAGA